MSELLTKEEKQKLVYVKGLSEVLSNYVLVISHAKDPAKQLQEAIEADDYYRKRIND